MNGSDREELVFFGKVTAGFTHELKNVLAIIREASGLIDDLLSLCQDAAFPQKERILRAIGTIQTQVNRGVELSSRLNRFAHTTDEQTAPVELDQVARQMALLCERFARSKNVVLKSIQSSATPSLVTDPVWLSMAVYLALECCWNEMGPGGEIALCPSATDVGLGIELFCTGDSCQKAEFKNCVTASPGWPRLQQIMEKLGGRVEWLSSGPGVSLVLKG